MMSDAGYRLDSESYIFRVWPRFRVSHSCERRLKRHAIVFSITLLRDTIQQRQKPCKLIGYSTMMLTNHMKTYGFGQWWSNTLWIYMVVGVAYLFPSTAPFCVHVARAEVLDKQKPCVVVWIRTSFFILGMIVPIQEFDSIQSHYVCGVQEYHLAIV